MVYDSLSTGGLRFRFVCRWGHLAMDPKPNTNTKPNINTKTPHNPKLRRHSRVSTRESDT